MKLLGKKFKVRSVRRTRSTTATQPQLDETSLVAIGPTPDSDIRSISSKSIDSGAAVMDAMSTFGTPDTTADISLLEMPPPVKKKRSFLNVVRRRTSSLRSLRRHHSSFNGDNSFKFPEDTSTTSSLRNYTPTVNITVSDGSQEARETDDGWSHLLLGQAFIAQDRDTKPLSATFGGSDLVADDSVLQGLFLFDGGNDDEYYYEDEEDEDDYEWEVDSMMTVKSYFTERTGLTNRTVGTGTATEYTNGTGYTDETCYATDATDSTDSTTSTATPPEADDDVPKLGKARKAKSKRTSADAMEDFYMVMEDFASGGQACLASMSKGRPICV